MSAYSFFVINRGAQMCFFLIIWSCAASKNRTDSNYSLNLVEIRHPKKFSSLYRLKIQSRKFLRMSNLNQITMPLCHDLQSPRLRYLFVFLFVFFPILLTFKHYGIYENNAPVWYQWQNTHFVQFFARRLNTIGNTDKRGCVTSYREISSVGGNHVFLFWQWADSGVVVLCYLYQVCKVKMSHFVKNTLRVVQKSHLRTHLKLGIRNMSSLDISGLYPPIATPFNKDESIAYDKLENNIQKWNKIPFKGMLYITQTLCVQCHIKFACTSASRHN